MNQGNNQGITQDQFNTFLANYMKPQTSMTGAPVAAAQGGVFTQPTNAIIGEAGPEAVVPLSGDQGQVFQDILRRGAASRAMGPRPMQPNPQPARNPASILDILRMLGMTQGPERQGMLGAR